MEEAQKLTTKSIVFDKVLLRAIDKTLNSLGKSVGQSIYFHIENKYNIAKSEIPENLEGFQEGLEKIFGTGSRFIESLIIKNLHADIGCPLITERSEQVEFIECVGAARQSYLGSVTSQPVESQPYVLSPFPFFTVSVSTP
jgi:hypothetical protein